MRSGEQAGRGRVPLGAPPCPEWRRERLFKLQYVTSRTMSECSHLGDEAAVSANAETHLPPPHTTCPHNHSFTPIRLLPPYSQQRLQIGDHVRGGHKGEVTALEQQVGGLHAHTMGGGGEAVHGIDLSCTSDHHLLHCECKPLNCSTCMRDVRGVGHLPHMHVSSPSPWLTAPRRAGTAGSCR